MPRPDSSVPCSNQEPFFTFRRPPCASPTKTWLCCSASGKPSPGSTRTSPTSPIATCSPASMKKPRRQTKSPSFTRSCGDTLRAWPIFFQNSSLPTTSAGSWITPAIRPFEEQNRDLSMRRRNDLLHTDAFPTRPTHGARILRFFHNIHPDRGRDWMVTDPFAASRQPLYARKNSAAHSRQLPQAHRQAVCAGHRAGQASARDSSALPMTNS